MSQPRNEAPRREGLGMRGPGGGHMMMPQKPRNFRETMKRITQYIMKDLAGLIGVSMLSIVAVVLSIIGPYYLGQITTRFQEIILAGRPFETTDSTFIVQILTVLLIFYLVAFVVRLIEQLVMATFGQRIVHKMRLQVNEKLDRLPLSYFDRHVHGEVMSRVTNDVDTFSNSLQQTFTSIISGMITVFGVLGFMLFLSWQLTLVALLTVPLSMALTKNIFKVSQASFREQSKRIGQLNGHIEEIFTNHAIVRAFSQEEREYQAFMIHNTALTKVNEKASFMSALIFPVMGFVNNVGYVAVSFVGGWMALSGLLTIGAIQSFIMYLRIFTQQINQITQITNIIQSGVAAAERVFDVLDETEESAETRSSVDVRSLAPAIDFEHVEFFYNANTPLIRDLSLSVKPGEMIAIVGPTGAGKTTLVNLLLRFYEIKSGAIRLDGIDTRQLTRHDLRSIFGMVLQDTWLFHGSIADNIRYGRPQATNDEVMEAARQAHADRFIETLPGGYEFIIDEEANNLSAGEKQLVTIARALLADPKILILDEATSSVDTRLEMMIQNAMSRLLHRRTSFVIAHRLSTIKNADHIVVMQHGDIVEVGKHADLLTRNGVYAGLYQSQFEGQAI